MESLSFVKIQSQEITGLLKLALPVLTELDIAVISFLRYPSMRYGQTNL